MEDGRRNLVVQMIEAGVMAGAYRSLARAEPDAERGLLKIAARHSARVAALAAEICATAQLEAEAVARMPTTRE